MLMTVKTSTTKSYLIQHLSHLKLLAIVLILRQIQMQTSHIFLEERTTRLCTNLPVESKPTQKPTGLATHLLPSPAQPVLACANLACPTPAQPTQASPGLARPTSTRPALIHSSPERLTPARPTGPRLKLAQPNSGQTPPGRAQPYRGETS